MEIKLLLLWSKFRIDFWFKHASNGWLPSFNLRPFSVNIVMTHFCPLRFYQMYLFSCQNRASVIPIANPVEFLGVGNEFPCWIWLHVSIHPWIRSNEKEVVFRSAHFILHGKVPITWAEGTTQCKNISWYCPKNLWNS